MMKKLTLLYIASLLVPSCIFGLQFSEVKATLQNIENIIILASKNTVLNGIKLDLADADNAKNIISKFTTKHATIIEYLKTTLGSDTDAFDLPSDLTAILHPKYFGKMNGYSNLFMNYYIFSSACAYIVLLKDIALYDSTEPADFIHQKYFKLTQQANLMKIQISFFSNMN